MNLIKLDSLKARICFNSRGNKTIEIDAKTNNIVGRSSTPSGKSKGELEAVEFVDENIEKTLFLGFVWIFSIEVYGILSEYFTPRSITRISWSSHNSKHFFYRQHQVQGAWMT